MVIAVCSVKLNSTILRPFKADFGSAALPLRGVACGPFYNPMATLEGAIDQPRKP